jgi:hypothetical protein
MQEQRKGQTKIDNNFQFSYSSQIFET